MKNFDTSHKFHDISISCARCDRQYHFNLFKWRLSVRKVGQYPSLADISVEGVKEYTKVLQPIDRTEFHRAVGLAAHGVGIGAFVYLRRIFERLIDGRFADHKSAEGWTDETFASKRMNEKVSFLKAFLPKFLVDNSQIYSILSIGIHELEEQKCLTYFEVIKASIMEILEEDEIARRKRLRRESAEKELKKISSELGAAKLPEIRALAAMDRRNPPCCGAPLSTLH